MDPAAEGKVFPDVPFVVDPERVAAFRAVFGQVSGVPPTFLTAAEFTAFPMIVDDVELGLDFARVVHGSQEYEHRRPLVEGEKLAVRARIDSIRSKGGNAFLTVVMEMIGSEGEVAAVARSVMIERGEL